jgi:hypothetical protein
MEKRKSPLLRWTEETERRRVLEFAALRACEHVWPAERTEPSVKPGVSDCRPRWRIRIPLLAGAASLST